MLIFLGEKLVGANFYAFCNYDDKYQTKQGNRLEIEIMKAGRATPVEGIDGNNENENIISIIILILIMERD